MSDFRSLNQHWLMSHVEPDFLIAFPWIHTLLAVVIVGIPRTHGFRGNCVLGCPVLVSAELGYAF